VRFTACPTQLGGGGGGIPGQHFLFTNSSDNKTMAIRTADGQSCLSWRAPSSRSPEAEGGTAGTQVVAEPCNVTEGGQQWRLSTAAVPEDTGSTFLTPLGHCIHFAPYTEGNIRYESPPIVGGWSCVDADPALNFLPVRIAGRSAQQLVWAQDPARCVAATAAGGVTLPPCEPSDRSQHWALAAGQIISEVDGRCLTQHACRGCDHSVVSVAKCTAGAPEPRDRWEITEAGAVTSADGLCLGATPALQIPNLTVVAQPPVEVGRAARPSQCVLPQRSSWKEFSAPLVISLLSQYISRRAE
jgi:hypothetical protein